MARRRSRGLFDPDYRKAGWNRSTFAPKHSSMSITQLSLTIAFLGWLGVAFASPFDILSTTQGIAVSLGVMVVVWVTLAILIRKWAWQRIKRYATEDADELPEISFDNPFDDNVQQRGWFGKNGQGQAFEHEVAWMLNVLTDYKAVPCGRGGDGGADVKVYAGNRLVGIVQCKHYRSGPALPPGHIRELYAAKQQFGVKTAYLATTAHFTQASRDEAARLGIKLLDGDEIERMKRRAKALAKARDERQGVSLKNV
jgi:uncharacterized membrane protein (DUF485 family)